MNRKVLLPIIVIAAGLGVAAMLILNPNEVANSPRERIPPAISVGHPEPLVSPLIIHSQGTLEPAHRIRLAPEVSGRVIEISEHFQRGGAFQEGDFLLKLDDEDAKLNVDRARAQYEQANIGLQIAQREHERVKGLFEKQLVSMQSLEQADLNLSRAQAQEMEAKTARQQALLQLERTHIRAPFAGRVEQEFIDVGQFVNRGEKLAELLALSYYEVRLPIARDQLTYLDLPFSARGIIPAGERPKVTLIGEFAGREWVRHAELIRTEALIDQATRQVYGVARLPVELDHPETLLPLGLFVRAEIEGSKPAGAYRLPRSSLINGNQILIVDADKRLWMKQTEILRLEHDDVVVRGGIDEASLVAVRGLRTIVNGMHVNPVVEN